MIEPRESDALRGPVRVLDDDPAAEARYLTMVRPVDVLAALTDEQAIEAVRLLNRRLGIDRESV